MDFFISDVTQALLLSHAYNPWLVALSCLIATGGSVVAIFVVTATAKLQSKRTRQVLLWAGSIAFGLAVWSMHFIGMLAFSLCTTVRYNTTITLLSALPAVLAARMVLFIVARRQVTVRHLLLGGVVSGAGIGLMHYSGMLAMQMSAALRFDIADFVISLVVVVALATLSLGSRLWLVDRLRLPPVLANGLAALIMGLAVTTMHYEGMAAARFIGVAQTPLPVPPVDWEYLVILISIGVVAVLGLVASSVLLSKLIDSLAVLQLQGLELEAIIANATEAIVSIRVKGTVKQVNRAFETLFGYADDDIARQHVSTFLPQWTMLLEQAAPQFECETLGKRADGSEFPMRIALSRLTSGTLTYYVGFISDLSDVKRVQEQLMRDAHHDFLTGLRNRRFFEEQLRLELDRSERTLAPLSLIMLDIDHFKRINDTFGHVVGDRVLALLAATLEENSRRGDVAARYGGEEFMILLPNTDLAVALQVAERLRTETEKLELIHAGKRVRFTTSVGVTSLVDARNVTPEDLIRKVDKALYCAKDGGRNRVEVMP